MAGTVATTEITFDHLKKVEFDWASSAGGAADATTTAKFTGLLMRAIQIPDGGGTQPTDQYDVVVNDADGVDILHGLGADLSNAATTVKDHTDGLGAVVQSALTLGVTNAGDTKGGKTILYIR